MTRVGYGQVTKIHEIDEFFHALVVLRVESYEIWIEITLRDVTIKTSDTRVTNTTTAAPPDQMNPWNWHGIAHRHGPPPNQTPPPGRWYTKFDTAGAPAHTATSAETPARAVLYFSWPKHPSRCGCSYRTLHTVDLTYASLWQVRIMTASLHI